MTIAIATAYRWTYDELLAGRDGRPGLLSSILNQSSTDWRWYLSADPQSEQLDEITESASRDSRITVRIEAESTDLTGLRKQQAFDMLADERWFISLDSDDFLLPDAVASFALAITEIEKQSSQTPGLVSWYCRHSEVPGDSLPYNVKLSMPLTVDNLVKYSWLHEWGLCFRTAAVKLVGGYRPDLYATENYHLQGCLVHRFGAFGEICKVLHGRVVRNREREYDRERLAAAISTVRADFRELGYSEE